MSSFRGFTLAELLIALVILGVIATFTIPKVLTSQADTKNKATAKEAASMISGAFEAFKAAGNTVSGTTDTNDLTPYMNYVRVDTQTPIDDIPPSGTIQCSAGGNYCLRLHNGGMLLIRDYVSFSNTYATNAILYTFDPDSAVTTNKGVNFFIYTNGRMTSEAHISTGTVSSDGTRGPNAAADPSWWSWN